MQVDFKNKYLVELYTEGRSRKYNFPKDVITKFFMRVQQIEAAFSIYDLWKTPSVNFEKMKGYENRYSLRLDRTWCLEIEISWSNKDKTEGDVGILDITKHYGD